MKERESVVFAIIVAVFPLLIFNNVHGNSRQWYERPRRSYPGYGNFENQTMTYRSGDFNSNTRLITTWKWPFKQQNTIKVTRQPLGFANDDDDKMLPNDKFIFPDATVIKPSPSLQTRIGAAPSCNGKTFCEQVSDYPSSFVRDAIKNDRSLQNYANVDSLDFTFRINTASTESLCVATEQIVYPKTAQNANKQWLYVLNDANFTQGVRIETCMQEDQGCNIIGGFAEGYVTTCKQKYIHRQLAAIVDGAVSHELFRFPASCCCHVQFVGTSTRMRIGKTSSAQDKPDDINAN